VPDSTRLAQRRAASLPVLEAALRTASKTLTELR